VKGNGVDVNGNSFDTVYDSVTKFTWQYGWFDQGGDGLDYASASAACSTLGAGWTIPSDGDLGTIAANKWCGFQMPAHLSPTSFNSAVVFWTTTLAFDAITKDYQPKALDPYDGSELPTDSRYPFNRFGQTLGVRCIHY
jgi:hypothetical protein